MSTHALRRPLLVIMDMTEKCNLKCRMCHFSAHERIRFEPFDRELDPRGMMPLEVFREVAAELFPRAWRVVLACAAEPLIHPNFIDMVEITGRYKVPDAWFPTNLLALTEKKAEAICDAGIARVGVSMDGVTPAVYESIRVGGKFERLLKCLELFNSVRKGTRTELRLTFTWMKTNRDELALLPAFAEKWGFSELDVRFVVPTPGVDTTPELLDCEDPAVLQSELRQCAEDAARRGLRLGQFPSYEADSEMPRSRFGRIKRSLWRWKVGLERFEYARYRHIERLQGCAWPSYIYVVRPNGVVAPCQFWGQEPVGAFPGTDYASLARSGLLAEIKGGLASGRPVGSCQTCSQRREAFYWNLRRRRATPVEPPEAGSTEGPAAPAPTSPEGLVQLGRDAG